MKRRRDTGKWEVRWRDGGSNRSKSFTLKSDAERFKRQVDQAREVGQPLKHDRGRELLTEFVEIWWERHVVAECSSSTRSSYLAIWAKYIRPRLGGYRLREITPRVVDQFKADLIAAGVGISVVRKALVIVSGMYTCAERWEYVDRNPVRSIKIPVAERAYHVRVSAPHTVEAIRADLSARGLAADAVLIFVLAYAGLRPAEARALQWGDVRERSILVERAADAVSVKATKTRKIRSVRLLRPLAEDLEWWRARCPDCSRGALVFPTRRGTLWTKDDWDNWRNRVFKPAAGRLGASQRPYDLRHTFASLLIASGATAVETAAQLGHDAVLTPRTYAHLFDEFDLASRPDPVTEIEAARAQAGVRDVYASGVGTELLAVRGGAASESYRDEIAHDDLFITRDGGKADERIRTADPFITSERRVGDAGQRLSGSGTDCPATMRFLTAAR